MRRRLLIIFGLFALLALAVPVAALYYLAFTESGLAFIVDHVPRQIGSMKLHLGSARGTLARGITLGRLEIDQERVHIIAENISGRIALAPLLWQTIYTPDLRAERVFVQVRRRVRPIQKRTPRFLPPGLIVRVDRARVEAATLVTTNGRRFDGTDVQTSGFARHRTIRFLEAAFQLNTLRISGNATLHADDPMRLEIESRVVIEPGGQPAWVFAGSAKGDLNAVDVSAQITAPFRADIEGRALDLTRGWHWEATSQVHDFDLRTWGGNGALGRISGKLELRGDAKGFSAQGPLTPAGLGVGAFDTYFEGAYAERVVNARRIELLHPHSGANVTGSGTIGIVPNGPELDLSGTWRNFRWPLDAESAPVRSDQGEFEMRGVWPYELRAGGSLSVRDLQPIGFETVSRLARTHLELGATTLTVFGGKASLTGAIEWSPAQRWSATGSAQGIDPATVRQDLPGKLSFDFDASGEQFGAQGDFAIEVRQLGGVLRGAAATGGGKLARRAGTWELDKVRLGLGRTNLALDGRLGAGMDLIFSLSTDDLSLLARESKGQLSARGRLGGTRTEPVIDATLRARDLLHEGLALGRLDARIDFDARGQRPSHIEAQAATFRYGERTIDSLTLVLDGTAASHELTLDASATKLALHAEGSGAYTRGTWAGQIGTLTINGNELLHLELESPVRVNAGAELLQVEWFCLSGKPARLCADANWNPNAWSTTVNATDLPMTTLTAGMTPKVEYRGELTITARAFGGGGEPVQGTVRADLSDALIAHHLSNGRVDRITLGTGLLTLNATKTAIQAQGSLDAGEIGTLKASLALERGTDRWQDMPLTGELHAETAELGFITLYAPEIDRVAGRLNAHLAFGGTAGTPLVNGMLELSDGEIDLYQINLVMRDARMEARLLDNGLRFDGGAKIGAGSVRAAGELNWHERLPYGKFVLEGDNLRVVDVPEAQIDASPKLEFEISGRRIEVGGAVQVPFARIVPQDLTGAVRASSDEVLVGEEPEDPAKRFEVITGIALTLGDRVTLETSGLTGRISGGILVRSGGDDPTRASGELVIHEGKYTAYGRKLDIQRGRLLFTGGPIGNPGVDIRAVKQYPEVVAGVNVRGTLLQPRLTFFSEPSLPQSQVVSLILSGGSLESAQSNGNGAGNELLAQGGAILAQQIGARVGLEDVALEQNLDNETSLVLGKYLSPRLYVSYGVSLTESLNTLKLRYSLNDRWTVRTEVGEARGADLVYTIEK